MFARTAVPKLETNPLRTKLLGGITELVASEEPTRGESLWVNTCKARRLVAPAAICITGHLRVDTEWPRANHLAVNRETTRLKRLGWRKRWREFLSDRNRDLRQS